MSLHTPPHEKASADEFDSANEQVDGWSYLESEFEGAALDSFRPLARHAPGVLAGYAQLRQVAGLESPPAELTTREKELVILAISLAALKANPPPVLHARKAVRAGATVGQVAEVVSLCLSVGGIVTYQTGGRFVIEAAEDELSLRQSIDNEP
jgi:alkylhydroperoxidase/carboxymuconolactone decarboxylase family protein YurZ